MASGEVGRNGRSRPSSGCGATTAIYVWMACRAIPLLDNHGEVREWFGVTFDISARKHAEAERERDRGMVAHDAAEHRRRRDRDRDTTAA